ncbi:polynucleotide adenylyltransferase PcnB [Thiospirochaeta perfilievii]|uniref:Polynucleotide adenylyltransferase PcnB n=1 Tax=Thiospirochaeta perfilievii TaxID=252967 RepID=A0A5C1QCN9_9SPIO|nr:polynucleotide adenylyltransferase PcnB [Thiospirochaeta perfilievii]QEN03952.1 polynucleotide adenylyltransferase PcnB [Thiospirochaeta perfilievii]
MLIRYTTDKKGRPQKQAEVYQAKEHNINRSYIDKDAITVIEKLNRRGFQAYIVGGAVRDLMSKREPKDFDIVTDALPEDVKKIFRNSRIIGRRFKLVHIYFGAKIFEVATFRSLESTNNHNDYGGIEEDVLRRDFSINALYYSPSENQVIDYIGGVKDLRNKRLRSIIDLDTTFHEDPVRIIRGIKYSNISKLKIPFKLRMQMKKDVHLLNDVSISRLTEEVFKILLSGKSMIIMNDFIKYGLFSYLFPEINDPIIGKNRKEFKKQFFRDLDKLDKKLYRGVEKSKALALSYLLDAYLTGLGTFSTKNIVMKDFVHNIKTSLKPLIAPNVDVESAARILLKRKNIKINGKRRYSKNGGRPSFNKFKKIRKLDK